MNDNVKMGTGNYIGKFCLLGDPPEKKGSFEEYKGVILGNNNRLTKFVTIDAGAERDTEIGNNVLLCSGVYVGHDSKIGDNTVICAGAKIGGFVEIGKDCKIGMGVCIHQRVTIPDGVTIGMNSTITKTTELKPYAKYVGSPARELK